MITRQTVAQAYPVKPLGNVVEFLDHKRCPVKESERRAGPFPYYGANGQQGTIDDYIFDEPLVLLAEDGGFFDQPERGIAYRISGKTWVNNHAHVLRPQRGVEVNFLCRVLENYDVTPFISGTTRSKLTKSQAEKIEIPLPPLAEQKRIAAILDQADELRRKRRSTLMQLAKLPQAILSRMFERSSLLPEVFVHLKLADVVRADDRINYGVVQPGGESETGIPLVRVANVVDNDFSPGSLKKIGASIEVQYKRSRLRGDEILVACVGSIGAIALASPELVGANIARAVARVRVDESKADRRYLAEFLRLARTQRYFQAETRAVAQPTLNIKQLSETPILLPPLAMQREFSERIFEVTRLQAGLVSHLSALNTLFASLQHRAFRGELIAKAAERELAEVG